MARAETGSVDRIWQVTWSHRLGWKQIPLCGRREVEMLGGLFECQRQESTVEFDRHGVIASL